MPHTFLNRPRFFGRKPVPGDPMADFRWERVNALLYLLGGLIFVVGSVFFLPNLLRRSDAGAWLFTLGSLVYLVVAVHDMVEVVRSVRWRDSPGMGQVLERLAAVSYLVGAVLFCVGSALFLRFLDNVQLGAWCFVAGSLFFLAGACINALLIVRFRTQQTLQLANLTAVAFIVGSVLFVVASVPYLWTMENDALRRTLYEYIAWQFIVGSGLFLLGGAFNYWRAALVARVAGQGSQAAR